MKLAKIIFYVIIILSSTNFVVSSKIYDPTIENDNLKKIIYHLPSNKLVYYKDDKLTFNYLIYKNDYYITVNKIYIKNIKNYKIDYIKFDEDFFVPNQSIFIYNNKLNLLKTYNISDFNKLFTYITRSTEILNLYEEQYYYLNDTLLKLKPKVIETDKKTDFMEIQVFCIDKDKEYFLFEILR